MKPDFTGRFSNKKDLNQVEAISGATISSKAVIDSVQKRAEEIKALIK
jgi:Na+-translocating ferredoxin:NAD+ oxidoreductase RnfG subunit